MFVLVVIELLTLYRIKIDETRLNTNSLKKEYDFDSLLCKLVIYIENTHMFSICSEMMRPHIFFIYTRL